MSRPLEEDYSDVLTPVEYTSAQTSTAPLPVVPVGPVGRRRHRKHRSLVDRVPVRKLLTGSLLALAASLTYAAVVFASPDGRAVREQAVPAIPASSQPHAVISAPPTTPHRAQPPQSREPERALPVPAYTSRRPSVTPRPRVSVKPEPSETTTTGPPTTPSPTGTTTPPPATSSPPVTPTASGVTQTISQEPTP